MNITLLRYLILLLLLAFSAVTHIEAQTSENLTTETEAPLIVNQKGAQLSKRKSLLAITRTSASIESSIESLLAKKDLTEGDQRKLEDLRERLDSLEKNFTEISSGIDLMTFRREVGDKSFDWTSELKVLLQPLINELKRITSQPREIDRYKTILVELKEQITLTKNAIKNIDRLISSSNNQPLLLLLADEKSKWKSQLLEYETQLSINRQKLNQKLGGRRSVLETVGSLPDLFFKGRAQNLLLAVAAVILFWLALNWFRLFLSRKRILQVKNQSFRSRLIYILYLVFRSIGSVFIFMLALFLLGDWVLLILGVIFLLGILWTSKQLVPKFWNQATIMLNVGSVREGERIEYNGLPWIVKTLNFYSHLINPALDCGTIRIPINELEELQSRMYAENEPWFPTMNGDWVILDDEIYGRIIWQGIDQVKVSELGGSVKNYSTQSFLNLNPRNISNGFRISISFGFDYGIQEISTSEVPEKLKSFIEKGLEAEKLNKRCELKVEFEEAAASSLNVAVICDFNGDLAAKYRTLRRLINKLCVDACNEHEWSIPFGQLTVHMANHTE